MQAVINAITEGVVNGIGSGEQSPMPIDCRRLFHGRGHCYHNLAHINVDWYHPVILITLYQEVESALWQQLIEGIRPIKGLVDCLLCQRRFLPGAPIECVWGDKPEQAVAHEQGMQFLLSFSDKQNVGLFLDMSPGRQWLRERAKHKRVLNLFAYTCSLSVAAVCGGAHSVVNVDMSRAALTVGRDNHRLNGHQSVLKRDVQFMPYNIFRSWKAIINKGPFDIIVVDPPSRQKGSFVAEKDYAKVIRRLTALMPAGGDVLLCLNAPELSEGFLRDCVDQQCATAQWVSRLTNRQDFPEKDPQRNVKMLHYRIPAQC